MTCESSACFKTLKRQNLDESRFQGAFRLLPVLGTRPCTAPIHLAAALQTLPWLLPHTGELLGGPSCGSHLRTSATLRPCLRLLRSIFLLGIRALLLSARLVANALPALQNTMPMWHGANLSSIVLTIFGSTLKGTKYLYNIVLYIYMLVALTCSVSPSIHFAEPTTQSYRSKGYNMCSPVLAAPTAGSGRLLTLSTTE